MKQASKCAIKPEMWNSVKKQVFVVGGTHGNEPTGVHIVRSLMNSEDTLAKFTFKCTPVIANPRAVELNRRYCDTDLNRCFRDDDIHNAKHIHLYEVNRARHLARQMGRSSNEANVILDIHNTTANTGVFLLMDSEDIFSHQIAKYILDNHSSDIRIGQWKSTADNPFLPTVGYSGMTVEVGPVSQGCLEPKIYNEAKLAIDLALEFIEKHNAIAKNEPEISDETFSLEVFRKIGSFDYPRDENGELMGMIHPSLQGNDFCILKHGDPILQHFDGSVIYWDNSKYPRQNLYAYFINEAAYYEKGVAFAVAEKVVCDIPTSLVKE